MEARHKDIEVRLAELSRRQQHPPAAQSSSSVMDELRRALGGMTLAGPPAPRPYTPAAAGIGNQRGTHLFANFTQPGAPATPAPVPYAPAPARAQRPFRHTPVRLVDPLRTALPHHPDTPAGHVAYARQMADYTAQHGTTRPHETLPHPLRPGTLAASTGACFKCGVDIPRRHSSHECVSTTPVPDLELRYRIVAAVCHGLIRGPQPPEELLPQAGHGAQVVRMNEVTNMTETQIADLQAEGAFITESDQGNGDGLLA